MPIMDGITATQELRRRGNNSRVVGLTANADEETRLEAMNAGMDELLTKPVTIAALHRVSSQLRPAV